MHNSGCPDPGASPRSSNCGSGPINSTCDHLLTYDTAKSALSLDIGGCINTVILPSGNGGTTLNCASLSALFTSGAAPTATTKLLGDGCKTYTINQLVTAVAAFGGDKQLLSIVGPKLLISNGNDVALADLVAAALSISPLPPNLAGALTTAVTQILSTSPLSPAILQAFTSSLTQTLMQSPLPPALITAISNSIAAALSNPTSAASLAVVDLIKSTVNCAFIGGLFTTSTTAPTASVELIGKDCKSYKVSDIAAFVSANATIKAENILPGPLSTGVTLLPSAIQPGQLPTSVKVNCASLEGHVEAAAVDAAFVLGEACKKYKMKPVRSAVLGTILGYQIAA